MQGQGFAGSQEEFVFYIMHCFKKKKFVGIAQCTL
jgi:hypothetical protein